MADRKISELTNITGANVDDANDEIAIVDASATQTKAITRAELFSSVSSMSLSGGTIDGTTIGGTTAASGTFTDLTVDKATLSAIAASKADTAVDVFVYDTSKDSDGGAWRKRTQGTSWYNETLNTATRGSRREFPAVAVIVAEAAKVTIYDGDDPALPMWMVFNANGSLGSDSNVFSDISEIASVSCLNGEIAAATDNGGRAGLRRIRFLYDDTILHRVGADFNRYNGVIAERNDGLTYRPDSTVGKLVDVECNDVAMTVLPNAPIDPATGLPVPTIAVATDGGVSVITDSGAVYDSAKTTAATDATIDGNRLRIAFTDSDVLVYDLAPIAADSFTGDIYDPATTPALLGTTTTLAKAASGSSAGITLLAEDEATPANGMIARVTSSYNSGYQNGDIKGAFLSDTDDTDLVGSGELVTNGTFDTDISGWTDFDPARGTTSWDAGTLKLVNDGTGFHFASQQLTGLTIGKNYVLTFDVTASGGGTTPQIRLGNTVGTSAVGVVSTGANGTGFFEFTFKPQVTSVYVQAFLLGGTGAGVFANFDNISVKLADEDRSVNNNGLIVNGTITREPVASGADLVAYSGFSASNYLEMPYNSDLDFGTGDFCIMGWVKPTALTFGRTILELVGGLRVTMNTGYLTAYTTTAVTSSLLLSTGSWQFISVRRSSGSLYFGLNGVEAPAIANTGDVGQTGVMKIGYGTLPEFPGSLALLRISATAPTAEQIAKIYEDEKVLFQENAQASLAGTSDAVTALAHDPVTDLLHVGTSAGRSVFQGLRRVSNTTDAVTTAISASNDLIVEQ